MKSKKEREREWLQMVALERDVAMIGARFCFPFGFFFKFLRTFVWHFAPCEYCFTQSKELTHLLLAGGAVATPMMKIPMQMMIARTPIRAPNLLRFCCKGVWLAEVSLARGGIL